MANKYIEYALLCHQKNKKEKEMIFLYQLGNYVLN